MKGNVYVCTWQIVGSRVRVWVTSRPDLVAEAASFTLADQELVNVIAEATGDQESVHEYEPPKPDTILRGSDDNKPIWITVPVGVGLGWWAPGFWLWLVVIIVTGLIVAVIFWTRPARGEFNRRLCIVGLMPMCGMSLNAAYLLAAGMVTVAQVVLISVIVAILRAIV